MYALKMNLAIKNNRRSRVLCRQLHDFFVWKHARPTPGLEGYLTPFLHIYMNTSSKH